MDQATQDNGTALVPAERLMPRNVTLVDQWDESQASVRHAFNLATEQGKLNYIACLTGSDAEAQRSTDQELTIVGWLLHVVDRIDDDTGEVRKGLRLVLLTDQGKRISTGSGPLIDNWAHVVRMLSGAGEWPRLTLRLKAVKSSKGKWSYLQIDSVSFPKEAVKVKR